MDLRNKSADMKISKHCFKYYDTVFVLLFIFIISSLIYIAKTGIGVPDESFYFTIPHRLLLGDSLLVDDWHVSQFSSFMQYIPLKLFYEINGSLDGVILFFRYLYIFFQCVTLIAVYPFFRKYGFKGAVALNIFGCYVPVMLLTLNYYTLCLWPAVIVCTVIIFSDNIKKPVLILLGVLFAICVLAEPLMAVCYFIYTLVVLLKKLISKKYIGFLRSGEYYINGKYWIFITIGIFLTAIPFLFFLFRGSDIKTSIEAIKYLFNGVEYDFSFSSGNIQTLKVAKRALELYGYLPAVGIAVLTVVSLIFVRYRKHIRPFVVLGVAFCLGYAYIHAIYVAINLNHTDYFLLFYGLPLYLSGPVFFILLDNKDKKLLRLYCFGAFMSLLLDISSAVILGVCGAISSIASFIFMCRLFEECISEIREKETGTKLLHIFAHCSACFVALCLVLTVANELAFDVYRLKFNIIETSHSADYTHGVCDTELDRGAYAGISTTKTVAAKYNAIHNDLDVIKENCKGNVLIFDRFGYCYLYLDLPYATYSAWYIDWQENDRLLYYYEVHPEKMPDYIYLPLYDPYNYRYDSDADEKLEWLEENFSCEVTSGEAGYIICIK